MRLNKTKILEERSKLENHPLLIENSIKNISDLQIFMNHHAYAVWDFMSLLKSIQHNIAPTSIPWVPTNGVRSELCRVINEIVMCEESDIDINGGFISHFDLYLQAMYEVQADHQSITDFIDTVTSGIDPISASTSAPARRFMRSTFNMIDNGPHCAAASFCYGRETVLPDVFNRILKQLNLNSVNAPKFHYYLNRHIEVDTDDHGPMSERLVDFFTDGDPIKILEAEDAAINSIKARIRLFDDILEEIKEG